MIPRRLAAFLLLTFAVILALFLEPRLMAHAAGVASSQMEMASSSTAFATSVPSASQTSEAGRWPALSEIEGNAWLVLDCGTGRALLEFNADKPVFPASTTKIMTAILALESKKLDRTVMVSAAAVNLPSGSSKIGLVSGETVRLRDLLYGLMLASGNDAANVLAEGLAGSQAAFVEWMNQKAAGIGMNNSHFCNPSGLQNEAHVVTARDMAKLAAYAMKNQQFGELVSTCTYSMPATNKHPYRGWALLNNTNRFLQFGDSALKSDFLSGYSGIKTGSTDSAGNNLISAATTVSGHKLVCVLLGVPLNSRLGNPFNYSRTLLEEAAREIETTQSSTTMTSATSALSSESTETAAKTTQSSDAATLPETTPLPETSTVLPSETSGGQGQPNGKLSGFTALNALNDFLLANPWRTATICLSLALLILILLALLICRRQRNR